MDLKFQSELKELHNNIVWNKEERKYKFERRAGKVVKAVFYNILNIPRNTFYYWEYGRANPSRTKILSIILFLSDYFGNIQGFFKDICELFKNPNVNLLAFNQDKKAEIILYQQLHSVFTTGNRLYSSEDFTDITFISGNARQSYLRQCIFNLLMGESGSQIDKILNLKEGLFEQLLEGVDTKKDSYLRRLADTIFYLTFGQGGQNYKSIKYVVENEWKIFELMTTHKQFIYLVMNRGDCQIDEIPLEVKCRSHGHESTKAIKALLNGRRGCPDCHDYKNQKITSAMFYELFLKVNKNPNIKVKNFDRQKRYYEIFDSEFIEGQDDYDSDWYSHLWTIDGFIILQVGQGDDAQILEIGIESDGEQHDPFEGFEAWLGMNGKSSASDDLKANLRKKWLRKVIQCDNFKDELFNHEDSENMYLIRVPTYSEKASVENRIGYILGELKEKCGLDLGIEISQLDTLSESDWLERFEIYFSD